MVDQQRDASEETLQPPAPEKFNEKVRRGCFWVVQYWRELFNFKFDKYMIIQVMPGVYGIALAPIATTPWPARRITSTNSNCLAHNRTLPAPNWPNKAGRCTARLC
jgi:hypothetical protein